MSDGNLKTQSTGYSQNASFTIVECKPERPVPQLQHRGPTAADNGLPTPADLPTLPRLSASAAASTTDTARIGRHVDQCKNHARPEDHCLCHAASTLRRLHDHVQQHPQTASPHRDGDQARRVQQRTLGIRIRCKGSNQKKPQIPSTAEFDCDVRDARLEGDYATVTGKVTAVNAFNAPITSSFRVIYLRDPMKPIEVTFDGKSTVLNVVEKLRRDEALEHESQNAKEAN